MRRLTMLALCALLAACSSTSVASPPSTSAGAASASSATSIDGMVDIGGQRQIRATCAGWQNPGPTVVLVSGSQKAGDEWMATMKPGASGLSPSSLETSDRSVFAQLATSARVCAYDRPGTLANDGGISATTKVAQPTTAQQGVADLEAWLQAAQVAPPYVLVGHSWGGMIATLFAATYPSQTAGLVLVDPASVFLEDHLNDAQWQQFMAQTNALLDGSRREAPDYRHSVDAVRVAEIGTIPVVVLTADKPFDFGVGIDAWPAWLAAADSLASTLHGSHVTDTSSGHMIPNENPDVVVAAIKDVVGQSH